MTIPHWPETLPQRPLRGLEMSPVDVKSTFEPSVGAPIGRPRTTGALFTARPQFKLIDTQIATFEDFYATDLAQGSKRFVMRNAVTDEVRLWQFLGAYRSQYISKIRAHVATDLLMLPHIPWFGPYVPADVSTVPAWVADYENDIYGIAGEKVAASELTGIEGTYLVKRTVSGTTTEQEETLVAYDITETAPADTTLIVGFTV